MNEGRNVDQHLEQQATAIRRCCLDESTISKIQELPKGSRPDPATYMTKEQIEAHLSQFAGGGSFVMTHDQYAMFVDQKDKIGYPDNSQYMTSKEYMDGIANMAKGDFFVYERELGLNQGCFSDGGGMVRIDIYRPHDHNARMPSGNEMGTNSHFIPGGYTDGGAPECVTDNIPNKNRYRKIIKTKKVKEV